MTDIVERLRACHGIISGDPECCCEEAADEIERLRAAIERLMDQPTMNPIDMTPDQRKELWAAHEDARAALEPKP